LQTKDDGEYVKAAYWQATLDMTPHLGPYRGYWNYSHAGWPLLFFTKNKNPPKSFSGGL